MTRILLSQADVTDAEARAVAEAMGSGWVAPLGPNVDAFEAALAQRLGVGHALALSSGTAALHLGLLCAGVRPGDKVVVSSMTFAASANAVVYAGAEPVFVDATRADGNVDPELLVAAVDTLAAEGTPAAAVMPVDLFGRSCDYDAFLPHLSERGIPVIEDAAEALGATYHGRAAGSFGAAAALSFNGNKIMTTSGGGMLVSDDGDLLARARYLSTQARAPHPWYEHVDIGYNYRLSNILAALGLVQASRLDAMIARRREIRGRYAAAFAGLPGVSLLGSTPDRDDAEDNCWLTSIVLDPAVCRLDADALVARLDAADIEARHLWKPMHLQPVFVANRAFVNGNSEYLFTHGVNLPSGSALSDEAIDRVIVETRRAVEASA